VNFHTLPNAYKIKQINNKANHLLEFEYTLLGKLGVQVLVLVLGTQYLYILLVLVLVLGRVSEYLYLHTVYL